MKIENDSFYNSYKLGKQGDKRLHNKSSKKQAKEVRELRKNGSRGKCWLSVA